MKKLIVSPAPHVHSDRTTKSLMRDVLIALAPSLLVSIYFFGFSAVKLVAIGVIACCLVEYLIQKYILKTKTTIGDYSAAVTGCLLALNLPPNAPWWLVAVGAIFAIGVVKMSFGGLGQNIFNPAIAGRVFLLISFPVLMTDWTIPASWFDNVNSLDAVSSATPLAAAKEAIANGTPLSEVPAYGDLTWKQMFFFKVGGSAGEVSALALILGFIYLLVRKVIKPTIPVVIIATVAIMSGIFNAIDPQSYTGPLFNICTGGVLLGSIFMATDYVTSPMTTKGQIIFAFGIGVITVLIRYFGSYPEGVSFAILIMNCAVPLINKYCKPRRFGEAK
ncbi:MAG: RnfABCDGE type electron transport complex subunit D [Bacteroidales bacterium]|nr:RnfABCDGE type electron transport complex subunit D [Candidatus Cacconaster merdequi]